MRSLLQPTQIKGASGWAALPLRGFITGVKAQTQERQVRSDLLPHPHQVPVLVDDGELPHPPGLVFELVHARDAA